MKINLFILSLIILTLPIQSEEKLMRIFIPDFKLVELTNIPENYKKNFSTLKSMHNELTKKTIETVDNFGKFEIVSSEELEEIFKDLNLIKHKSDFDEKTLIKIGKLANAEYLLLGTLTKGTFNNNTVNLKLIELITGKYIYSTTITQILKKKMFEEIENSISIISSVDYNIEKFQSNRNKIIILNLEPINIKKKSADIATKLLGASFLIYKKYWQIKQNDLDNGLNQLNLKNSSTIDIKNVIELGKITKSRLVILGEIKQPQEKISVILRVIEVESGNIIYENKIETTSKNEIPIIMDRFAKLISDKKSIDETDKATINLDMEKAKKTKNLGIGMLSPGLSLTAIGLGSTIAGIILFSIYPSRLQNINYISSNEQIKYSNETSNILLAAVINLPLGIILLTPGLILSFMSIQHFIAAKKYKKDSNINFIPDIYVGQDKLILSLNIKF
ncbi:MAG: hypothetical protein JXB50_12350 [Spirochaetes bacterium]|nr:hypothetical protein [Spirochaetota bacterium]